MRKPKPLSGASSGPSEPSALPANPGVASGTVRTQSTAVKVSSGPLPDPETLKSYNAVYPDLAKTIVASFEAEYKKRPSLETSAMEGDIEAMRSSHADVQRGQWLEDSLLP